ncbi:hypothetical protein F4780DRAFT_640051 [Xylariomycetidae sp. FL0641]|nr:hypothetical protein F4780DRAFT_640051 [Xylariomycetidae sp. FL0641]
MMPPADHRGYAPEYASAQPAEDSEEDYAEIFAQLREADEARARAGDVRSLWTTANSTISHLSSRFVTEPNVDFSGGWQLQLQNLWHLYYVAGRYCAEESVAPLVLQVLETSQRGLLSRRQFSSNGRPGGTEHASFLVDLGGQATPQYLWREMPLFVPAMSGYWFQDCARMSKSQRVRTSFFLSSLVAASTEQWAYGLCNIALMVLRDTLESERRLVSAVVEPGGEESENPGRSMDMLTISDLLPSANAWLMRAGSRIAQLCEMGDRSASREASVPGGDGLSQLGTLALEAGVRNVAGGFSTARWFFWLRRLEEIGVETPSPSSFGAAPFIQRVRAEKQQARQVAHNMLYSASQMDSSIVGELMRIRRLPL